MARRPSSAIRKFKTVELKIRTAVQSLTEAMTEIDQRLAVRRTPEEQAILHSIRAQTAKVRDDVRNVMGRLFDEVGG